MIPGDAADLDDQKGQRQGATFERPADLQLVGVLQMCHLAVQLPKSVARHMMQSRLAYVFDAVLVHKVTFQAIAMQDGSLPQVCKPVIKR